jgi:protein SCO1/2
MEGEAAAPRSGLDFVRRWIWYIGIAAGLLMITAVRPFLIHRPPLPEAIGSVPAQFSAVDQDGAAFGPEALRGRVWVVGFVFTRCPSLCPQITRAMASFRDALERGGLQDDVSLLSVTVDPDYDTPERLRAYADAHGIEGAGWRLIRVGDPAATEAFVVGGFRVAIGEPTAVAPGVFDIAHSSKLALVDRHGAIRGFYSIDEEGLEELFHRALAVVRDEADRAAGEE